MSLSLFSCKSPFSAVILLKILFLDIKVTGFIDRFKGKLEMYSVNVVPTRQNSLVVIFDNFRIGLNILIHREDDHPAVSGLFNNRLLQPGIYMYGSLYMCCQGRSEPSPKFWC